MKILRLIWVTSMCIGILGILGIAGLVVAVSSKAISIASNQH